MDLLLTERFDLLMFNETLPVLDGVELIGTIRANSPLGRIPIIALPSRPGTILQLAKSHVQAILPKPFSIDDLCRTVAKTIDHSKSNAAAFPAFSAQLSLGV